MNDMTGSGPALAGLSTALMTPEPHTESENATSGYFAPCQHAVPAGHGMAVVLKRGSSNARVYDPRKVREV